jgi:hypothetical protein
MSGLPRLDPRRSLRQATYPQLLHHSLGHDRDEAEPLFGGDGQHVAALPGFEATTDAVV